MTSKNSRGKGESLTSERRLEGVERQVKALDLRKAGLSFPAIAEKLGYSGPGGAYKAVMTAIRRTQQEPADEVRRLELERLDIMLQKTWEWVENGEPRAIDRVLRIMERRAKYLGLDAPVKVDMVHTVIDEARRLAQAEGLDEDAVVAEARRILAESVR